MTLAQVVYQMSNDPDFAAQLLASPEATLAKYGLRLSKEEIAFLLTAHRREDQTRTRIAALAQTHASNWRG